MIILIYSETNAKTVARNIGRSEYSYYFVLRSFRPLLERLGAVVEIVDPAIEVDAAYDRVTASGEACVFLCFNPPHKTPLGLRCPTIPVFAWEFDTLPNENWGDDTRHDWVSVLAGLGRAIVHSQHTVDVVRQAVGDDFPVASIPAPVHDRFAAMRLAIMSDTMAGTPRARPGARAVALTVSSPYFDSRDTPWTRLDRFAGEDERHAITLEILAAADMPRHIELDGIVYTSVFNPFDGRKRAWDMIDNFVWAFRDRPDATLLLKITNHDVPLVMSALLGEMAKMQPYRCRILVIQGYIPQDAYDAIVRATTYIVNCSAGEGQCLPLMEFMSCGKPAVAPTNSAMADYVNEANAFIVAGHPEPTVWPHDKRALFRTKRSRIDFHSLILAFQDSFIVAITDPARYHAMSDAAVESLARHCADEVTLARLRSALLAPKAASAGAPETANAGAPEAANAGVA